jgi:gas vesicle protein
MLGAAVGAAIGLLYAPRPGADTRREFAARSDDLRRRAAEAGAELEQRSAALTERVRERDADEAVDQPTDAGPIEEASESGSEETGQVEV